MSGEWLLPLGGLSVPSADAPPAELLASEAVQLFVARRPRSSQASTRRTGARHRRHRESVGGMPLAILLAANWARLLRRRRDRRELELSLDVLAEEGESGPTTPQRARDVRAVVAPADAPRAQCCVAVRLCGAFAREAAAMLPRPACRCWAPWRTSRCCARATTAASRCTLLCSNGGRGYSQDATTARRRHCDYFALRLGHLRDHEVGPQPCDAPSRWTSSFEDMRRRPGGKRSPRSDGDGGRKRWHRPAGALSQHRGSHRGRHLSCSVRA